MMDYAGVKIVLNDIATSPNEADIEDLKEELTEATRWVRDRIVMRGNDKAPGPVREIHSAEFEAAVPLMENVRGLLTLGHFDRAASIAKEVLALFG
jgi:hypothetical protein